MSTGLVEVLTECRVEIPTLKSKDQIVQDNAAPNENDSPLMVLGQGDLNVKLAKSLEAAFQQPNCMFSVYADLKLRTVRISVATTQVDVFEKSVIENRIK